MQLQRHNIQDLGKDREEGLRVREEKREREQYDLYLIKRMLCKKLACRCGGSNAKLSMDRQ